MQIANYPDRASAEFCCLHRAESVCRGLSFLAGQFGPAYESKKRKGNFLVSYFCMSKASSLSLEDNNIP